MAKPLILELGGSTNPIFFMDYERAARLEPHALALLFPALNEDDLDSLTRDIVERGQIHAVVLYENKILDGVHRTKACCKNFMDVKCVQFADLKYNGTASDFVWSENSERRHLDDKTLAVIEASLLNFDKLRRDQADAGKLGGRGHKKNPGPNSDQGLSSPKRAPKSSDKIAARTGVSRNTAEQAIAIAKRAPELVPQIAQGKVSFEAAAQEAKQRAPARKPPAKNSGMKRKPWPQPYALPNAIFKKRREHIASNSCVSSSRGFRNAWHDLIHSAKLRLFPIFAAIYRRRHNETRPSHRRTDR